MAPECRSTTRRGSRNNNDGPGRLPAADSSGTHRFHDGPTSGAGHGTLAAFDRVGVLGVCTIASRAGDRATAARSHVGGAVTTGLAPRASNTIAVLTMVVPETCNARTLEGSWLSDCADTGRQR